MSEALNQSALEARLSSADAREKALYEKLTSLGIAWKTYSHPPVFTVQESQSLCSMVPGQHTKNLFLKDKKRGLWLVVAREDQRVDLNALANMLNAPRFSFGSAHELVATLGVPPGAVTPFALMNPESANVSPVLDKLMIEASILNFHPLRNDRTIAVTPGDLLKFVHACGHKPAIIALPEKAP